VSPRVARSGEKRSTRVDRTDDSTRVDRTDHSMRIATTGPATPGRPFA
jgi:hypothetical protein